MPKAAVILSFYNKLEVLKLVLASLEMQTEDDFEVIIADDGSHDDVVGELQDFMKHLELDVKHSWHEDKGWQKNRILNQAVRESSSNYLIFVDGDCLLHRHFVRKHLKYSEPKVALTGRRVNLSERITNKLSVERIEKGYLDKPVFYDSLKDLPAGRVKDVEQGIYLGASKVASWLNRKEKGILGSNFSLHRDDFYAINGFDERFDEPAAGEDTDIEQRLKRNGCKIKTLRNRAIQYHIYHEELPRKDSRLKYLHENNSNQVTFTPHGIIRKE